jgi:hypothetical protein
MVPMVKNGLFTQSIVNALFSLSELAQEPKE